MLGPENPILQSGEVVLWEDELADRGSSKCYVRYRVMNDCWFVLLRSYIRLDKVAIRIMDTRIFHKFGTDEIIRDFLVKEDSWQKLADGGFNFDSEWLLSPY
jgi:type 2A phosphatase activator TIP41